MEAQADAETLFRDYGGEAYREARPRERDTVLPDGTTFAGWYWLSRLLSVALTRSEHVPSDRANTNCNDDVPIDRASNFAISPGRGRRWAR
jgi:hypothetical protein